MRPLAVVGNVNVDLIMGPFEPWPKAGTEVLAETDLLRPGGAAGNVALAWQALGVGHQVAATTGDDVFAQFLRDAFPESASKWSRERTATTLSVGITHPDGERTFFTSRGHLPAMKLAHAVDALDADALAGGLLLLCGSFLMPHLMADYAKLFDWASTHAIEIALDTGWPPAGWTQETIAATRSWLPHCRHLLLNEAELTAFAEISDPRKAANKVVADMPANGTVVVKRGPLGAAAACRNGEVAEVRGRNVRVIDTIGAGDVFNAGYLLAVARGEPIAHALQLGVDMASTAISTEPRRYSPPLPPLEGNDA